MNSGSKAQMWRGVTLFSGLAFNFLKTAAISAFSAAIFYKIMSRLQAQVTSSRHSLATTLTLLPKPVSSSLLLWNCTTNMRPSQVTHGIN